MFVASSAERTRDTINVAGTTGLAKPISLVDKSPTINRMTKSVGSTNSSQVVQDGIKLQAEIPLKYFKAR